MKKIFTFYIIILLFGIAFGKFEVTEVYFDGSQEYIELQYTGDLIYSGTLTIDGIKSSRSSYEVAIESDEVFLIGDSLEQLLEIACYTIENAKLSLVDTKEIHIDVHRNSGSSSLSINENAVKALNNKKRSFIRQGDEYIAIPDKKSKNTLDGLFGSPCFYEGTTEERSAPIVNDSDDQMNSSSGQVTTGLTGGVGGSILSGNISSILSGETVGTGSSQIGTGDRVVLPFENNNPITENLDQEDPVSSITDETIAPKECAESSIVLKPGDIRINAVSPKNGILSDEFLILHSHVFYSGTIHIVGLGRLAKEVSLDVTIQPGGDYIITKDGLGFTTGAALLFVEGLSLTDGGETLRIRDNTNTTIDEVYWSGSKKDILLTSYQTNIPRQLATETTNSLLFDAFKSISCALHITEDVVTLYEQSICSLPGESTWRYGSDTTTECEDGIQYNPSASGLITFTKSIGDKEICTSSIFYDGTTAKDENGSLGTGESEILSTSGSVWISEISPRTGFFPEYIELTIEDAFVGVISITGLGQGSTSKEISIDDKTPRTIILSDEKVDSIPDYLQYALPSISLTDGGERLEVRHRGQLIDTLSYSGVSSNSLSWNRKSYNAPLYLDSQTPSFDLQQIQHLLPIEGEQEFSCGIRIQNTNPFTSDNKLNLIAQVGSKDIANSTTAYRCSWTFPDEYLPSNSDEYAHCNPGFLEVLSPGVHQIGLKMIDISGKVCTTEFSINTPELQKDGGSSGNARGGYYEKLYKKRKGRFEFLKKNIKPYGLSSTSSGNIINGAEQPLPTFKEGGRLFASGVVSIIKLMPNPAGSDTDAEKIVLYVSGDKQVNTAGRTIDTGKKKISFPEVVLQPGVHTTIQGSLGLVNSERCVSLLSAEKEIYDTFCYTNAADDQWFEQSERALESLLHTQDQLVDFYDLKITFSETDACIEYKGEQLRCKPQQISKQELKSLKKQATKFTSLEKKYNKEFDRRKKYQTQLKEQKKKLTAYKKVAKKKLDAQKDKSKKYRQDVVFQKRLNRLHLGIIALWSGYLQDDYMSMYLGSSLDTAWQSYRKALQGMYTDDQLLYYGPVVFDSVDIETISAYLDGKPVRIKNENPPNTVLKPFYGNIGEWITIQ